MGHVVLIIDDDEINLQIARTILERKLSCKVICADNGIVGLDILRKQHVDLVLLDIFMPYFDGIETLQEIRADIQIASVPVMIFTSSADKKTVRRALELGVKDYIRKPLKPDELAERVGKKLIEIDRSIEHVLVIGDDAGELADMQQTIEDNFPHEVLTAATVDAAEKILRERNITLVVACADMKFANGFRVLNFMTAKKKFNAVPFAVMNADNLRETLAKINPSEAEESPSDSSMTVKDKKKFSNAVTVVIVDR